MKIEIRLLDDIRNEHGKLLEIVEAAGDNFAKAQEIAVGAMIRNARKQFGADNFCAKTDTSIFGGYYCNPNNGDCIVAR